MQRKCPFWLRTRVPVFLDEYKHELDDKHVLVHPKMIVISAG